MAKTRKGRSRSKTQKKNTDLLTIPELRSSIDHMDSYANKLVSSKVPLSAAAKNFASEWKHVLGKQLSPKAATDFIKYKMKQHKHGKTRRHRGGGYANLGAPLDHITRAGADLPHGNYPEHVTKGFWNPEPAILQDAASQQTTPYSTTGSNKMNGGGLLNSWGSALAAASFRPVVAQNPLSNQHAAMLSFKGLPIGPGAASYNNPDLQKN
jgi:hypothetical protein